MNTQVIDGHGCALSQGSTDNGFGGLDCRVQISIYWNETLVDVVERSASKKDAPLFSIGEAPTCDFVVSRDVLHGHNSHSLVAMQGGRIEVLDPKLGASQVSRRASWVALGPWRFEVRLVEPSPVPSRALSMDWRSGAMWSFSLLLHMAFALVIAFIPPPAAGLSFDSSSYGSRIVDCVLNVPEMKPVPEVPRPDAEQAGTGQTGQAHEGDVGQAGDQASPRTHRRYGIKRLSDRLPLAMAKEDRRDMAQNSGILVALANIRVPTSPFGSSLESGVDPANALGALLGDSIGDNFGYHGLGIRGTGRRGGGDGRGTIGVDLRGIIGDGIKGGDGRPRKLLDRGVHSRVSKSPRLRSGTAKVVGALSKEIIRRVVRRSYPQISHCYEKGLMDNPDLAGRVSIFFKIGGSGGVMSATVGSSTLSHPATAQCIAQVFQRMAFPPIEGGGIVVATYPIQLMSGS